MMRSYLIKFEKFFLNILFLWVKMYIDMGFMSLNDFVDLLGPY